MIRGQFRRRARARIRALLGNKPRTKRAHDVFERLQHDIDPLFEEINWTGDPGGEEEEEANLVYDVPHRVQRQMTWLSYVSTRLKELPPNAKLLDVGSNLFWTVGVAASPLDVTVVDVRGHPLADSFPFRFVKTSVLDLPFEDDEFDVVSFPQVLHHVGLTFGQVIRANEYRGGLNEIARVLKSGGQAVLSTWVRAGQTLVGPGRPRIFGVRHLQHLFDESGFDIVDWHFISQSTFQKIAEEELKETSATPSDWATITLRRRQ